MAWQESPLRGVKLFSPMASAKTILAGDAGQQAGALSRMIPCVLLDSTLILSIACICFEMLCDLQGPSIDLCPSSVDSSNVVGSAQGTGRRLSDSSADRLSSSHGLGLDGPELERLLRCLTREDHFFTPWCLRASCGGQAALRSECAEWKQSVIISRLSFAPIAQTCVSVPHELLMLSTSGC